MSYILHPEPMVKKNLWATFYPNGGWGPQPGCLPALFPPFLCSHYRSWQYYAQTINNPKMYLAYQCDSYEDFSSGICYGFSYMGEGVLTTSRGIFYVDTDIPNYPLKV